jgi:hypothetical protein
MERNPLMPLPKTAQEIAIEKRKLEQRILHLVKEFEFDTGTVVDQILFWGPEKSGSRIKVRSTIPDLSENSLDEGLKELVPEIFEEATV